MRKSTSCLDIMMRLHVEDLAGVKAAFESYGRDGLDLEAFVRIMVERLVWTPSTVVDLVYELVDLFGHIVINGQGTMVWEDFTSALIEAGMATGLDETHWRDMKYEDNVLFVDRTSRQPKHVEYISEIRKLIVFEGTRPVMQIYDPTAILASEAAESSVDDPGNAPTSLPLTHEIHPLAYTSGYRRDQDAVRSEHSPVQAIKYLTTLDILAVSAGDLKLSFWNCAIMFTSEIPTPMELVATEHPQRILEWAPKPSRLFTVSIDNRILVWTVIVKGNKKCCVACTAILDKHSDIVQGLLLVNDDTLVSCSMDSLIYIWDPNTLECKSTRAGHKRGIRTLAKHSSTVFVSAGFEMDMLGWDVSGLSIAPIFQLTGHMAPIVAIQIVTGFDQAISLDEDGWFKWWNLQNLISTDDCDRCLQTFRFGNDQYPWKPTSFTLFHNGATIIACGYRVKWVHRVRLKSKSVASNTVLYNDSSFTVLTSTDKEIQVWDALTGALLHVFRNVTKSDITQVVFDSLQRKCIVANQGGELFVLNAANGALLKTFPRHSNQISCLVYCKEDTCVLSASWDKSLRVYDDMATNNPLLRSISDAHENDIKCLAYSHSLSLVATGSNDGHIKIWDFVYFLLEQQHHTTSEVNCLVFVEPFPVLVSGHENGDVHVFTVRPAAIPQLLFTFSSPASIVVLQTYYDESGGDVVREGITTGRHVLVGGDQAGMLRCWNLSHVFEAGRVAATVEQTLPSSQDSYNPRRRIHREGHNAARLDRHLHQLPPTHQQETPQLSHAGAHLIEVVAEWKAHLMGIRSMCVVAESPQVIFTCSFDKSTKVWAYGGECLGVLCGDKEGPFWHLAVDTDSVSERKLHFAQALWGRLKDHLQLTTLQTPTTTPTTLSHRAKNRRKNQAVINLVEPPCIDTQPEPPTEKDRLFGQLRGEMTYKKPEIQLARERAWEVEAAKYQGRMEKIFKPKPSDILLSSPVIPSIPSSSFMESLDQDNWSDTAKSTLTALPQLNSTQLSQVPYDDKDNWKIDSKNRQKMIYNHLYTETCRTAKQLQGKRQPKLMLEAIDVAPSAFLLQKLGPDKATYRKPKALQHQSSTKALRRVDGLTPSPSLPALRHTTARTTSPPRKQLSAPKYPPDKIPQNQHMDEIERIIQHATNGPISGVNTANLASQTPLKVAPVHEKRQSSVLQRYTKLINDENLGKKTSKKQSGMKNSSKMARIESTDMSTKLVHNKAMVPDRKSRPIKGVGMMDTTKDQVQSDQALLIRQTFGPYAKDSVYEVCKLFVDTDVDNSGSIETKEFVQRLIQAQGPEMKDDLEILFDRMDHDHNGSLDMVEMLKVCLNTTLMGRDNKKIYLKCIDAVQMLFDRILICIKTQDIYNIYILRSLK
ncbi:hypothetical protein, variant 1 [Aphanomyces astaci]|uniref:EF-hand domain-containing protein n=1 Tax=Aphanomyces astaci TaxID=112090 RepID=W4FPS3_APHAT|nr:hypothetical protein, variant 1 [Aphanomyces astaci]ETV69487.1 hypothetical protein, variant 1 [Aphanomyces astaci]|eukprot:XP_009841060.1 hypothetical protein, variant 1 [Aphanomyces astaci]